MLLIISDRSRIYTDKLGKSGQLWTVATSYIYIYYKLLGNYIDQLRFCIQELRELGF